MGELLLLESELINVYEGKEKEQIVGGRELHEFLEVGTEYAKWMTRMIEYGFEENIDYMVIVKKSRGNKGGRPRYDHNLTIPTTLKVISLNSRNKNSDILYAYLSKLSNKNVIVHKQPRKEYVFGEMLDKITGLEWLTQYPIDDGKYRLDFYLPSTLIIEYDECYHEHQKEKDIERIHYCREWLNLNGEYENYDDKWRIPVIRVKEGKELEGLNRIIKHLVGFEVIDAYNYNMEVCDINNKSIATKVHIKITNNIT